MPSVSADNNYETRRKILGMIDEKDKLEQQLKSSYQALQSHGVGMNEPLVDDNDFPRNDIDVYQIRFLRHSIICTRNDLKALMDRIEKSLSIYHAQLYRNAEERLVNGNCSLKPEH